MKKSSSYLAIATLTVGIVIIGMLTAMAAVEVESAKFDPERPMTGEPVRLVIKLGGEAIMAEVTWLVNDTEVGKSDYNGLVPYVELDKKVTAGDKVTATVRPFDSAGSPGKDVTKSVTVVNAPPVVELRDPKIADRTYTAKVYATDPEGGPVSYTVVEGPPGMTIDQNGNVTWKINEGVGGNYQVRISVKDDKGAESILQYPLGIKWQGGGR